MSRSLVPRVAVQTDIRIFKTTWFSGAAAPRADRAKRGTSRSPAGLSFRVRSTGHLNLLPAYFDHPENKSTVDGPRPSFRLRAGGKKTFYRSTQNRIESGSSRRVPEHRPRHPNFTRLSSLPPSTAILSSRAEG